MTDHSIEPEGPYRTVTECCVVNPTNFANSIFSQAEQCRRGSEN